MMTTNPETDGIVDWLVRYATRAVRRDAPVTSVRNVSELANNLRLRLEEQ